jgi:hypothetical protein
MRKHCALRSNSGKKGEVKALRKEGIFYPRFRFAFAQAKIAFVTHDFFGYFFSKKK